MIFSFSLRTRLSIRDAAGGFCFAHQLAHARGDPFSPGATPRRWPHRSQTAALPQWPARRFRPQCLRPESRAHSAWPRRASRQSAVCPVPPRRPLRKPSSRNAEAALYFARVRNWNRGPAANALITPKPLAQFGGLARRLIAVKLHAIEAQRARQRRHHLRGPVHEDAHRGHQRRQLAAQSPTPPPG